MKIDVLTLFPEMVEGPMTQSIIGKAIEAGKIEFETTDFRQFSNNKHNHVDDYPFGGGAGMLLKVEPIDLALASIRERSPKTTPRVILMDPAGKTFTQKDAEELAKEEHLVFICGHYEGYDERIMALVDQELSVGDYVLTGGELPAMTIIDSIVRLIPGVLGGENSTAIESFSDGETLEFPQYTRPEEWRGMKVPEVLLSGHHGNIATWRAAHSRKVD